MHFFALSLIADRKFMMNFPYLIGTYIQKIKGCILMIYFVVIIFAVFYSCLFQIQLHPIASESSISPVYASLLFSMSIR